HSPADAQSLIRATAFPTIDLIPGGPALAPFDLSHRAAWEKDNLHYALAEALAPVLPDYDLVLIDCPPRLSLMSFAALCASDGALCPLEAADWGAQGVLAVTAAIEHVQRHFRPSLKLLGYV